MIQKYLFYDKNINRQWQSNPRFLKQNHWNARRKLYIINFKLIQIKNTIKILTAAESNPRFF